MSTKPHRRRSRRRRPKRKTLKNAPRAGASIVPAVAPDDAKADVQVDVEAVTAAARARRRACGIPADEGHRPKWMMVLEMIDGLAEHGLRPPLLVADAGFGDNSQFRDALDERRIPYIMQVKGDALAHPPHAVPHARVWSGHGRPPTRTSLRYPDTAKSLVEHVHAVGPAAAATISWREGSQGTMSSQFTFLRVLPAGHRVARDGDGLLPERWRSPNGPTASRSRSSTGCLACPPTPTPPT